MKDRSTQQYQSSTAVRQDSKQLAARLPMDLIGVAGFVVVAALLLAIVDTGSAVLRIVVGFPLLLFVPGYATVAALFPRTAADGRRETNSRPLIDRRSVTDGERVALAFGLSLAILPLLGLVIAAASWEYSTSVAVGVVCVYALSVACIGAIRRLRVPTEQRYRLNLMRRASALHAAVFETKSPVHTAVNVALVVAMLVALTTVGYALVAPQDGERYTSLEILTEDDDGELVADPPSEVDSGEELSFVVGIENREGEEMEYTVVVQEQWVSDDGVIDRHEHDRIEAQVSDGETAYGDREITTEATGGDVRIAVLLYEDDAPSNPTTDNAYRYGYFWTEIVDDA
ncbi:DUF1616 domain-containing protein [Natrialba swarupiae]|uniref:DUF1616 domain-containing protein n=1 Tax=Natrialba swarupiae TaxID=2448032 RepID=A0A5D5AP72_9EURY|nr:DUF1616 domain-containing protein [Natrialba swarupiae]TYT63486.1 DUF1616 domain-containing protein [Natrialba swarupiae]